MLAPPSSANTTFYPRTEVVALQQSYWVNHVIGLSYECYSFQKTVGLL